MALAALVRLALWFFGSFLELAILVLFRGLALLLVASVDLVRLPGQAADAALEATKGAIEAAAEFAFGLVWEVAVAVVSAFLESLWSVVAGAAELASSAVGVLMEAARDGSEEAAKALAEALEGAADAVAGTLVKLGENYMDALMHVLQNLI
jgi:enoyl-CoA hydratase/carnithine racemase